MRPTILVSLACCLGALACSDAEPPQAQDDEPAAAAASGEEAIPEPDIVYGRQVLMTALDNMMLPIDRAAAGDPFDMGDARRRAEAISAILMAFPFMFPEGTGPDETHDNDWPSIATNLVWTENEAFHEKAEEVSGIAFELVAMTDEAEFRARAGELRQGCDSCHASFMYDWRGEESGLDPVTGEPLPRP